MHIIEIDLKTKGECIAFLKGLFYSPNVSPIGFRRLKIETGSYYGALELAQSDRPEYVAAAINHDEDESSVLDSRISQIIDDNLASGSGDDFDESEIYLTKIYPETEMYSAERGE